MSYKVWLCVFVLAGCSTPAAEQDFTAPGEIEWTDDGTIEVEFEPEPDITFAEPDPPPPEPDPSWSQSMMGPCMCWCPVGP